MKILILAFWVAISVFLLVSVWYGVAWIIETGNQIKVISQENR